MPIIEMRQITKSFPGVIANDHVNLSIEKGEIHGILGENGAGKTTLMNTLSGMYSPDEGDIFLKGKAVKFRSPRDAIAQGVGMVHQHFMLVPSFTVAENILVGLQSNMSVLKLDQVRKEILKLSEQYGLGVSPDARIWQLSAGERQRVEILKVLYRAVDILILDEPTSVLTPQETKELFTTMRSLSERGCTILFVTHKLYEAMEITGRITVLRNGKVVSTIETKEATQEKLARMMIGRDVIFRISKNPPKIADIVLETKGLCALKDNGLPALRNVSLSIRSGEILGIAGVAGNGQKELAEVLTGLRKVTLGQINFLGEDITNRSTEEILKLGIGHIPDDKMDGLILGISVADNAILENYPQFTKRFFLDFSAINQYVDKTIKAFNVKCPGRQALTAQLSGGNLQRLILGRELSRNLKLLIACNPTRGLDVGATEYIHTKLVEQRDEGRAILLISENLDEILDLSDRIAVMYEGEIRGIVHSGEAESEEIGLMMVGARRET